MKATKCGTQRNVCKGKTRKGSHKRRDGQDYWDARLLAAGLGMDRARCIGHEDIIYGQDIADLDFFADRKDKRFELIGERQDTGHGKR